jgi:hypothetical protein
VVFGISRVIQYGEVLILIISSKVGRNVAFRERGQVDASSVVGIIFIWQEVDLELRMCKGAFFYTFINHNSLLSYLQVP